MMSSSTIGWWTSATLAMTMMIASPAVTQGEAYWPEYRGPDAQGYVPWASLPTSWSEQRNVAWKTAIPHRGWSSPVIYGDQIWMTTATEDGHELFAVCVDLETGEIVHNFKVFDQPEPQTINPLNSHASPSPVIEEGRVYVHFGSYGTAAIDTDSAEVIWERRDLTLDHSEGPGSSPILFEDLLIFHCDGVDVQYVIALDKATGETAWKTSRSRDFSQIPQHRHKAYATPVIVEVEGELHLISQGAEAIYGYDPRTGEEFWRVELSGYSNVPRPVVGDGMLYVSTGYDVADLVAIRLDGSRGDLTDTHVVWRLERQQAPRRPSFILVDGLLYTVSDGGIAQAVDAATGESVWRERFGGDYSSSQLYDGEHLYFFNQQGHGIVFRPGAEFEQVARNELDDGLMASPAVAGDALILRTRTHLYRIEERQ